MRMYGLRKRELGILLLGDVAAFYISLYATLLLRYLSFPSADILYNHLPPFSVLIVLWILVFMMGGLYDKHTVFFKKRLPHTILRVQFVNILLAALFFFLVPSVGIAPKLNLVIYLIISSAIIIFWRLFIFTRMGVRRSLTALIVGEGSEVEELVEEVNSNTTRYHFSFVRIVDSGETDSDAFAKRLTDAVLHEGIGIMVARPDDPVFVRHSALLFHLSVLDRRLGIVDFSKMYEEIFNRVPLSALTYSWFLRNLSRGPQKMAASIKRVFDLAAGSILAGLFLLILPFVGFFIMLEDRGPIFIRQTRVGRYGRPMTVWKLRTMRASDTGAWTGETANEVTGIGKFLRKASIDEWPQALNILTGEMSLIGPRNDIAGLAERLNVHIPFYAVRTMVKPGITGWAQVNQYYAPGNISPQSIEETKMRLAYDLYYIRHQTIFLDVVIVMRTIAAILSRFGVSLNLR